MCRETVLGSGFPNFGNFLFWVWKDASGAPTLDKSNSKPKLKSGKTKDDEKTNWNKHNCESEYFDPAYTQVSK